jgi:hypothetical protein
VRIPTRLLTAAVAAGIALALGGAPAVLADDVVVRGAVTSEYLYNTEEDASAFDGRVEFDLETGPFLIGAVYRAYQLSDPDYNPAMKEIPASEIRHRYAEFRGESFSARAGHFFATFGRGLSLRSYEQVDLEYDTALDGVLVRYEPGPARITALSGVISEPLSEWRTRAHTVRGIEVTGSPWDWASLGGSAVERSWVDEDEDIVLPDSLARGEDVVLDGSLDLRFGPVALAGEYARRDGQNPVTGRDAVEGRAAYLSGTFDLGWATLFGEFKDYDGFAHYLVNPPTGIREHPWTLMNRATYEIDLNDERGFLAEGTVPLGEDLSLVGGASEARTHDGELSHWEIYGEASHSFFETVSGAVGGAWSREYLLGKFTEHVTGAADFDVELPAGQAAEVGLEAGWTDDVTGASYHDYLASITWYPGSDFTVFAVFEASTAEFERRDTWLIGEVKKRISDELEIALAAGSERGGKKCAGGVCYFEPEFVGVRLRLNSYF